MATKLFVLPPGCSAWFELVVEEPYEECLDKAFPDPTSKHVQDALTQQTFTTLDNRRVLVDAPIFAIEEDPHVN